MSNVANDALDVILAAYNQNPRDWFTVKDLVQRTGLSSDTIVDTLLSRPDKFKQRMLLGSPIFGLVYDRTVPGSIRAGAVQNGD